jgi:membrane protease subunit HflK
MMGTPLPKNVIFIRSLFEWVRKHAVRAWGLVILIILLLSLFDVPYRVNIGQVGVTRRLGRFTGVVATPGLNFRFPWGIDHVDIINADNIHTLYLPLKLEKDKSSGLEYFTGDANLIEICCTLQYQINNAPNYLFHVELPESMVIGWIQEILINNFGIENVDRILSSNREAIQNRVFASLQSEIQPLELGIEFISFNLYSVMPPPAAIPAFQDVITAKEERYFDVNLAQQHKTEVVAKAKGYAERIVQVAKAEAFSRIKQAQGASDRFNLVVAKYWSYPSETKLTEYYKTISKVAAHSDIYIIRPNQGTQLEINLLDQVTPPQSMKAKSKTEKAEKKKDKNKMDIQNVLLPPTSYDQRTDRAPGAGLHQEPGEKVMHNELPTTTEPIPNSELEMIDEQ